jgi:hypothetical protein
MSDISFGPVQNEKDLEILQFDHEPPSTTTYNFITKCGEKYSLGTVIVTRYCDNEPIFGKIIKIYGTAIDIRFIINKIEFDIFYHHYYAFHVVNISDVPTNSIKLDETSYYHDPCLLVTVKESQYIATKYCIY